MIVFKRLMKVAVMYIPIFLLELLMSMITTDCCLQILTNIPVQLQILEDKEII